MEVREDIINTIDRDMELEIDLFIEAVKRKCQYDFGEYSRNHIRRRILNKMNKDNMASISAMQGKIIHDNDYLHEVLLEFSINVTEMFRDIEFFKRIREEVIPYLQSYGRLKIWNAGCATGQEAYTMAIILSEEKLLERSIIYATDFNNDSVKKGKAGVYDIKMLSKYEENYIKSGGKRNFKEYYQRAEEYFEMDEKLRSRMVFSEHNLSTDGVFGEMNIIFCRNVLIYFNKELQKRVIELFYNSLRIGGMLCLGMNEMIDSSIIENRFDLYDAKNKIYKKISYNFRFA